MALPVAVAPSLSQTSILSFPSHEVFLYTPEMITGILRLHGREPGRCSGSKGVTWYAARRLRSIATLTQIR